MDPLFSIQFETQTAKFVAYLLFLVITTILIVYATILLFDNISMMGKVHGQLSPSSSLPSSSSSSSTSPSPPLSVKIVSPDKGQSTDIKSNLEIFGISAYNPNYHCHVSVIMNDIKPYQKTIPTGSKIENDYSTWKYILDSNYTTIKEGDNKITARLECSDEHGDDMRKWYSVNVIGQDDNESYYQGSSETTVAVPIDTEGPSGKSLTNIEIDRDVFIELINDRIGDNAKVIKDSIEDSIKSVYTRID